MFYPGAQKHAGDLFLLMKLRNNNKFAKLLGL